MGTRTGVVMDIQKMSLSQRKRRYLLLNLASVCAGWGLIGLDYFVILRINYAGHYFEGLVFTVLNIGLVLLSFKLYRLAMKYKPESSCDGEKYD